MGSEMYDAQLHAVEYSHDKCCLRCGNRWRELIDQKPHPLFGTLGMTVDTFKCLVCGKTIVE